MASEESVPQQGSEFENEASKGEDASPQSTKQLFDAQGQRFILGNGSGNLPRGYAAEGFFQIPSDFVAPFGIL